MAKKDFSDRPNPAIIPALQFITVKTEEPETAPEETPDAVPEAAAEPPATEKAPAAKASAPAPASKRVTPARTPQTQAVARKNERKTKRLNLLLRPSVMEDLQKIATMRRTSVNDLINEALQAFAQKNKPLIIQHDEVFGPKQG